MSSTKFNFSVGSYDFRLQVEADHHGATNTHNTRSRPHGQKQQHTSLTQPAHSAHTAGSTQTTGAAGDNSGQRRAGMESVCALGVCPLSVSTAVSS